MLWRTLFTAAVLAVSDARAADDLFDFSDLDVIDPPSVEKVKEPEHPRPEDDALKGLPESIRTVLGKLDHFSSFKRAALMKEITEARKVAAEILVKRATAADAATRASLLDEAKRVESLPPELLLIESAGSSSAQPSVASSVIIGSWRRLNNESWSNSFAAGGTFKHWNGKTGHWFWLDERRGALVCDYTPQMGYADLVQIDLKSKTFKASAIGDDGGVFSIMKAGSPATPVQKNSKPTEPVIKLAAHEATTRKETEALIRSKNAKVATWLLKQAPSLPAPQARVIVERASELERKPDGANLESNGGTSGGRSARGLNGIWSWAGKKLEFADGGVVNVNQKKGGKWVWAKSNSKSFIAFVLEADDTVALARFLDGNESVLHITLMKGKRSEARCLTERGVKLTAAELDAILGEYQYGPAVMTVTRRGDSVFAQLAGQPKFQIYPKTATEFEWHVVPASVKFSKDKNGKVTKAVHTQDGATFDAPKNK